MIKSLLEHIFGLFEITKRKTKKNEIGKQCNFKSSNLTQKSLYSFGCTIHEKIRFRARVLWCDRHCCLCGKECGTVIEVHDIEQKGENLSDIDNAIPLCRNCHGKIKSYDSKHRVGTSYKIKEIKARRDQIYDKHTRHLVPPLVFYLTPRLGNPRFSQIRLPKVSFVIENHGLFLPVKIMVNIEVFLDSEELKPIVNPKKPYYTSEGIMWNLNAGHTFFENFSIPKKCCENTENLKIEVQVIATDPYGRSHPLLPTCYSYAKDKGWWTEPTSFSELKNSWIIP